MAASTAERLQSQFPVVGTAWEDVDQGPTGLLTERGIGELTLLGERLAAEGTRTGSVRVDFVL